jgi:hypothetical protein
MNSSSWSVYQPERRLKPRINCDCPAIIQSYAADGKKIVEEGRMVNLSRNGMYIILYREFPVGMEIIVRVAIPTGNLSRGTTKLFVHGFVVRGEFRSETIFGIGVKFRRFRFN